MTPRGYIDGVIGSELVGWVLDEDKPGARLKVVAALDGIELGTVVADRPRGDLVAAGFGDGAHGFRVPLDGGGLEPGHHVVEARVIGRDEPLPLADGWVARDGDDRPLPDVVLRSPAAAARIDVPDPAAQIGLIGTGNWLYAVSPETVDAVRGAAPGTHAALDADVDAVEALGKLGGELGAAACCAIVPDKLQVYPEHAPPGLEVDPHGRWARRLSARLRDSDFATVVDLLDPLVDARAHGRVFPRTGRELSWAGAFHAYRAIAKSLAFRVPALAPRAAAGVTLGPHEPVEASLAAGPLAVWLDGQVVGVDGLARPVPADEEPTITLPRLKGRGRPTGLLVHDGSGTRIAHCFSEHFSRLTVAVGRRVDPDTARAARPDVVIWLRQDRG